MARRGRPKGAQSGAKPLIAWCAWGTANELTRKGYSSEGGARDKALAELENMRHFGESFSKELMIEIAANITEVRDSAFSGATEANPRKWSATDPVSGITFVVQLWSVK